MEQIAFQEKAVAQLLDVFKQLWRTGGDFREITFKAPTGSGKTYMTERFVCELCRQPDWTADVAFVWITFSDDLAMQSRDKFADYFFPNVPGRLLTVDDMDRLTAGLGRHDVLFLNWQKLVSKRAEDRQLRRPADERQRKEQGLYFEDVAERTHEAGREVVLIIDESHKSVTEAAQRDVIEPLRPRVVLKVSATPKQQPSASDVEHGRAGWVEVKRADVVAEGMIKEQVVCQTEDDLHRHGNEDLDELLLALAMARREELARQVRAFGLEVNPLVLIQLPNDDSLLDAQGVKRKEHVVTEFLLSHGVRPERIAYWFDRRRERMDGISRNDSPVDYLLFKQAAGTGWDCPRAQVLVMFREISSDTFHTQVVGRILRVPVRGVQGSSVFRTGYLYTNYRRNEVRTPEQNEANKPRTLVAANRLGSFAIDPLLRRDFTPRTDYGDLGSAPAFQRCLVEEFNRFFGLTADMPLDRRVRQLAAMGLQLSPMLTSEIMVDARIGDIDRIEAEMERSGTDTAYRMSRNDVEKTFTALCAALLREQTEEATRVSNVARSWSPLKSALRVWLKQALNAGEGMLYRIFVYDVTRGDETSLFRRALVRTLRTYRPLLDAQRQQACERAAGRESEPFRLLDCYAYTEDYEAQEMRRCLLRPFYIRKKYAGRDTELPFARFLDGLSAVDWWMKNGDSGKEFFAIRYHDTAKGRDELFFPDWMVRFKDGRIGLFDTKGGQTAVSAETRDKARALQRRIAWLNAHSTVRYVGGIVVKGNGQWYLNDAEEYRYQEGHLEGWKEFVEIVGQQV